jgi:LPS export ABC transporter protein LptC
LLDLVGNVEVRSSPTDGSEPLTIATEKLRFSPDTSSAESDGPVEIHVGDWQLTTIGLRTHLKGDTLELESQVHGTFAP